MHLSPQQDAFDAIFDGQFPTSHGPRNMRVVIRDGREVGRCDAVAVPRSKWLRAMRITEPFGTYPEPPRVGVNYREGVLT